MKILELCMFRNQVLCNIFSKKFQIINIILKVRIKLFQINIGIHVHKYIPESGCRCKFFGKGHWENIMLAKYQDSFHVSIRTLQFLTGNYQLTDINHARKRDLHVPFYRSSQSTVVSYFLNLIRLIFSEVLTYSPSCSSLELISSIIETHSLRFCSGFL